MSIAQMTFHSKLKNRCGKIISNFRLLSIVTYTHTDMIATGITPNIIGHLKSNERMMMMYKAFSYRIMRIPRSSFRARSRRA